MWTVGWARSTRKARTAFAQCMYMVELPLESSCSPIKGLRVVSTWNDTLITIVLTSQYAGDLDNAPMEVLGLQGRKPVRKAARKGRGVAGPTELINAA
jgi:hypothetical protein